MATRRSVQRDGRGFVAFHRNSAYQLSRFRVDDFDRPIFRSRFPGPDANVIEAFGRVIGRIVRVPRWGIFSACQLDSLGYLERSSVQCHRCVVSKIDPQFVGS